MSKQIKALIGVAIVALTMALGTSSAFAISEFASEKYATNLTGQATNEHVFKTKTGEIKCKTAQLTGTLAAKSPTVSLTPSYAMCNLGGIAATVQMNTCTFKMEAGIKVSEQESLGGMTLVCPGGNEVLIKINNCEIKIPGTEPLGFVDYKNNAGEQELEVNFDVGLFDYTLSANCLAAPGKYEDGILRGKSTIKGSNGPFGVIP
jgi:hypothetical protein